MCFNVYWHRPTRFGGGGAGEGGGDGGGGSVDRQLRILEAFFRAQGGIPHLGKLHSPAAFADAMRGKGERGRGEGRERSFIDNQETTEVTQGR